ncbi:hypothetical protein Tco_1177346, partial [Tanacetum coccineum]
TLGYDEDPETKLIAISKMVATRLHQPWRAILSVLNRCLTGKDSSWDTDEFEWQIVERSSRPLKMSKLLYTHFTKLIIDYLLSLNKIIPRRLDSKLHSSQDDHPITKLLNITNGDYKFGTKVPDAMISDAIKKKSGYQYYMAKKVESEKPKIIDKPKEQHVSPIKCRRVKGFKCYGNQVENVPNKLKKDVVPRKIRSLTIAKEAVVGELANSISIKEPLSQRRPRSQLTIDSQTDKAVADMYNEWGQKLKGPAVEDPAVYSDESANETDDADESDMDLSNDNPHGGDDDARYGVFMHNKSTATPNSTYLSPTVTSSSLDFIQTLLYETPVNELMNFMSHLVFTDAQTTSVVHNPEGNPKLTSYISGASEVPLGTHVDVLATKSLMQEMFPDENAYRIPSLPAKKIPYPTTYPQPSSLQVKAKKLMQKAKKNMRKFNFKKAVIQKFKEYDQKLEALKILMFIKHLKNASNKNF